jgi:hypothetical protein
MNPNPTPLPQTPASPSTNMNSPEPIRINRREALQWVLAASATVAAGRTPLEAAEAAEPGGKPYGTDPVLNKTYKPGDFWPLTLSSDQRRTVVALCDLIIPEDAVSPAASAVGVPDFIDEWISAPYAVQQRDRSTVLSGLKWIDAEAQKRFSKPFADITIEQRTQIADDICYLPKAKESMAEGATFFALFRNLTAGGFYTTPVGSKDIGYRGNTPLARFEGPPKAVLEKLGLA